ncbi:hypothetical protein ACU6U9_02570 [Pseudomonas sp. HK3]
MKVLTSKQTTGRYESQKKVVFTLSNQPEQYKAIVQLQKLETVEDVLRDHTAKHFNVISVEG